MDQPQNVYPGSPNQTGQPGNIPPPPPQEQQVGIRSMESDLKSIQQTGGESPQSQIISAPELSAARNQQTPPRPPYQPTPAPSPGQPSAADISATPTLSEEPIISPKKSFGLKSILMVIGVAILAVAVGFGVYYLVSSLKAEPQINLGGTQEPSGLPVAEPIPPPTPPAVEEPTTPEPTPLVHQSLITNPTKTETIKLPVTSSHNLQGLSLSSFRSAMSVSVEEKMLVGSVKDITFVDDGSAPIEAPDILNFLFLNGTPQPTTSVVGELLEKDFTSWLYADKIGGNKFGLIFQMKQDIDLGQIKAAMTQFIEQNTQGIPNIFVSSVTTPSKIEFKDGQVEEVPVRFLVFDSKVGNVFEYGWYAVGDSYYLILATSYNQMVDIVKRVKAIVPGSSGSTSTTTTSTTTP